MAISEAEANPAFQERLAKALAADEKPVKAPVERKRQTKPAEHKRPSNRRTPAMLDPVQLARNGESELREALGSGLIGHSQKMTVAARATAEKKTVGQRS